MPAETHEPVLPPPGASWTGDWDQEFHDRIFGGDPIVVGTIAALLTGVQHRSGATVSGVAVRVDGAVIGRGERQAVTADLTADQARELAAVLTMLAAQADALDGIAPDSACPDTSRPT